MDMFFSAWWAPIAGLSGFIAIACASRFILFHMFGVTIYEMRPDALGISKRLWGAHWNVTLPRDEMLCIEQIKDGGHGDDSFPSWALVGRCRTSHYLLKRQPIEKSDWLGPRVAGFFGIEYRPSRERD